MYGSISGLPAALMMLTMAKTTAGKKRREKAWVNKWEYHALNCVMSARVERVRPVMRKMSAMAPYLIWNQCWRRYESLERVSILLITHGVF